MVHALTRIHRAVRPGGIVADLRPDRFTSARQPKPRLPRIYWASHGGERFQGVLDRATENLVKHRAATRAVDKVLRRGLFALERTEAFEFRYHFRDLSVLERQLRTIWTAAFLRESVRRRLRTAAKRSRGGHIVVIEPLRLNVLGKR